MLREIPANQNLERTAPHCGRGAKGCFEDAVTARSDFPFTLRPVFHWPHSEETEKHNDSQRRSQKNDPGENRFGAVATPNAFGAGGRYRPSCSADSLAPSPAEL
jgi:hypothetical protein